MEQVKKMKQETREQSNKQVVSTDFLSEMKQEFKKISWTGKEELFLYTRIVVIATLVAGFSVFAVDWCIQAVLEILAKIIN